MSKVNVDKKVQVNVGVSVGSIALLLMIAGFVMENANYEPVLGALLFTIGFWLFFIPLIVIGVIAGIILLAVALSR